MLLRSVAVTPVMLLFSLAFALTYGTAALFTLLAVASGPLAQTTLITSYSLLIPTFYGIIFLREKAGWQTATGLLLLVLSIFFIYYRKVKKNRA